MNDVLALGLILLLATSGYAAGRLHGQFGYRMGYRYGYRQGYFDGDRASWTRRRRDLQAAVASVLKAPADVRGESYPGLAAYPDHTVGTTYTSTAHEDADEGPIEVPASPRSRGRHSRNARSEHPDLVKPPAQEEGAWPDPALAEVGTDG